MLDTVLDDLKLLLARPSDLPPLVGAFSLVWAFVLGAAWGSFTNVVIARVPAGESVVRPRSRCPQCKTQIAGFDNIPVFSWIFLRGRCRTCKATISWRYPFVEALLGIAGMAVVARHGWSVQALELYTFTLILTAIAFVDLDTWTVPNPLWMALVGSGLGFAAVRAWLDGSVQVLVDRGIGAGGAGICLGAFAVLMTGILRRVGRLAPDQHAMGWGDPLILIGVGAYLGWILLPVVLFIASLEGSVVGIALWARGGLKGDKPVSASDDWIPPKAAVPFGPFLALGALQAAFFGDALVARFMPAVRDLVQLSQ